MRRHAARYDIWGPDVMVAHKLEGQGYPGKIHASKAVVQCLRDSYVFEKSGKQIEVNSLDRCSEQHLGRVCHCGEVFVAANVAPIIGFRFAPQWPPVHVRCIRVSADSAYDYERFAKGDFRARSLVRRNEGRWARGPGSTDCDDACDS